jgi:hypothetical protein
MTALFIFLPGKLRLSEVEYDLATLTGSLYKVMAEN